MWPPAPGGLVIPLLDLDDVAPESRRDLVESIGDRGHRPGGGGPAQPRILVDGDDPLSIGQVENQRDDRMPAGANLEDRETPRVPSGFSHQTDELDRAPKSFVGVESVRTGDRLEPQVDSAAARYPTQHCQGPCLDLPVHQLSAT